MPSPDSDRYSCPALSGIEADNAPAPRNQIHQPLERRLHRIEIFVDVGMIEFDRSQNHRVGKVMQKFRTLIEECRVVFVAFEDEVLAIAQPEAAPEIFGYASDQERWPKPGSLEDPRQHRCRGRLAVRSGNHQYVFADQKFIVQNLRQRAERNALIKQPLQFNVAARNRIADDNQIGRRRQISFRRTAAAAECLKTPEMSTSADKPPHPSP